MTTQSNLSVPPHFKAGDLVRFKVDHPDIPKTSFTVTEVRDDSVSLGNGCWYGEGALELVTTIKPDPAPQPSEPAIPCSPLMKTAGEAMLSNASPQPETQETGKRPLVQRINDLLCARNVDGVSATQLYMVIEPDLAAARSEVSRLEEQNEGLRSDLLTLLKEIKDLRAQLSASAQKVESLRKALEQFGRHHVDCATQKALSLRPCNCGFSEALASTPAPAVKEKQL